MLFPVIVYAEYNWQPIVEIKRPNTKAYYDALSLKRHEMVSFGTLLHSFSTPEKIKIKNNTFMVSSMMRFSLIHCEKEIIIPIADYYFTDKLPGNDSKPIAGITYNAQPSTIELIDKKSFTYSVFCGPQI